MMYKNFKSHKMTIENMANCSITCNDYYCKCACGMDPYATSIQREQLDVMAKESLNNTYTF